MKFSGSKLRTLRGEANLSRDQLAALSGVSHGTIKRLEQGGSGTRLSTVGRLADALGVTPDDLMEAAA
jgi:transcriptional regulator with XRE-family HTH domain